MKSKVKSITYTPPPLPSFLFVLIKRIALYLLSFQQYRFLIKSNLWVFILVLSVLSVPQVTFSQEQEKFIPKNMYLGRGSWQAEMNRRGYYKHINGGGWVHRNATVAPHAYIGPDALVTGGRIEGGTISGNAKVSGGRITGGRIYGNARVSGGRITGGTISDNARVSGGTISGNARVSGGTISGNAEIRSGAIVTGGEISGNAEVRGKVSGGRVTRNAVIPQGFEIGHGMMIDNDGLLTTNRYRTRLRRLGRTALRKVPYAGAIVGLGIALFEFIKTDLSASEALKIGSQLIDETLLSAELGGDPPIGDYLQNLKIAAQHLNPRKRFSQKRQGLSNQLRTVYANIQEDQSLADEEKVEYLRIIEEIQETVQPSSAPRHPPSYRNRRSKGSRGISLNNREGEPTEPINLTTPTRGLASFSESKSLQCSCSCIEQEKQKDSKE